MSKEITNNVNFIADMNVIVSLANKKGLGAIKEPPRMVARLDSICAYNELTNQVSLFGLYIDDNGAKSESTKWIVITFNKLFQEHFGFSVTNDMTIIEASATANVRRIVQAICERGINQRLTRKIIRNQMWEAVKLLGSQFKQTQELLK